MKEALGMIEVKGLVAAIEIADTMAKVAAVNLKKTVRARGFGWTTIFISGDVAAVSAAIQAGKAVAEQHDWLVSFKVIPRPAEGVDELFEQEPSTVADVKKAEIETEDAKEQVVKEESNKHEGEPVEKNETKSPEKKVATQGNPAVKSKPSKKKKK